MTKLLILLLCLATLHTGAQAQTKYKLISYLNIPVDSVGNLPKNPYVIDLTNKNKHLIVIGTQHSRDTANKLFTEIEKIFYQFKPELIINEGGNLTKHFSSRNQAILKEGELGLEKFLADNAGINTLNGDMNDKLEFEELSKAYSKEEALLFFASERFIFPYAFGQFTGDFEKLYDSIFINKYLLKEGIHLTSDEKTLNFYTTSYEKYFHQKFSLDNISQLDFTPFSRKNHFNDVTRKSKEIRDIALLKKIGEQLKKHDKILVIFGGWHVLAIEPALKQIIERAK
ncbi:MAG: hypothetical protein ABIN67_06840 [Ferruginibacter sp.]